MVHEVGDDTVPKAIADSSFGTDTLGRRTVQAYDDLSRRSVLGAYSALSCASRQSADLCPLCRLSVQATKV